MLGVLSKAFKPPPTPPTLAQYRALKRRPERNEGGYRLRGVAFSDVDSGLPLVSIITVVRNGARTLERTIASVRAQDYPAIEYIVIDGASTDGTVDVVRAHEDVIAYWLSERDTGIYDGFNKGVAASTGRYIQFVNADDWLSEGQIARAVEVLERTDHDFTFGDCWLHGWKGQDVLLGGDPHYFLRIRKTMPSVQQVTLLCRRELFEQVGLFRTDLKIVSDYDWLVRLHLRGCVGVYEPGLVGHMRVGGISTRRQRLAVAEGFVVAVQNGYPLAPSIYHWAGRWIFIDGKPSWLIRGVGRWRSLVFGGSRVGRGLRARAGGLRRRVVNGARVLRAPLREAGDGSVGQGAGTPWWCTTRLVAFLDLRALPGGVSEAGLEWLLSRAAELQEVALVGVGEAIGQVANALERGCARVDRPTADREDLAELIAAVAFDHASGVGAIVGPLEAIRKVMPGLVPEFPGGQTLAVLVAAGVGLGEASVRQFGNLIVIESESPRGGGTSVVDVQETDE